MNCAAHNNFSAHAAGQRSRKARHKAFHFAHIAAYVVADYAVAARNAAHKNALVVLQFEARAVQLVFDDEFVKALFCGPLFKLFGIRGFFLTPHRNKMAHFFVG